MQVLILVHVALWLLGKHFDWFGGKTLSPVEPSEGIEFVANGVINAGTVFFALALLSTFIFGRWFCGWGCHVVLLQDWCYALLRKFGVRPKPFRSRLLMMFPLGLALYMFVWPLFYRFVVLKLPFPSIQTEFMTEDYWNSFASPLVAIPFLLVCGFATVYVLGAKGFCTYGCPYGGFFAPIDSTSPMRVRVNDSCQQCGKCTAVCTSNVRVHEEVNIYGMVIDNGCMKIMDCVDACPNDALRISFGTTALRKRTTKRKYDVSISGEFFIVLLFLFAFFAFRRLYEWIPMLMAVGISLVCTWIVWKAFRVIKDENASFHSAQLKFHGKWNIRGVLFVLFACVVVLFTTHSALIQSCKYLGNWARERGDDERAMLYYKLASPFEDGGFAIASNPNIDMVVARYLEDQMQFTEAFRLYSRIDMRVGQDEMSTMLLGQNMQFHAQFVPINQHYVGRLRENPNWEIVWEDYVGWLKREGQYEQAIAASKTSVAKNPIAIRLQIQRVLLEIEFGDAENAVVLAKQMTGEFPSVATPWMLLSRALDTVGDYAGARNAQAEAAEIQGER